MADEKHLAILKQGVEAWNKWREENRDVIPDLGYVDLSRANLSRANLGGVNMSDGNLSAADLSEAILNAANLSRTTLTDADMSRTYQLAVDMRSADLSGANLGAADLSGANLTNANLSRVNLFGVNLGTANLSGAKLNRADLSRTDLSRATLSEATLSEATLIEATLSEANLSWVICGETSFSGVDLSEVKGLESIRHYGRSYIDVHTLYRSQGKIPPIFLRGCGIPEEFITFLPSLTGKAIEFYSCFISYSHADKAFARRLFDTLQGRGIRCWLDEKQMNPGDDIYNEIDRGIRYWDKVLLCCSESALSEKWWVDHEIDKAFQKERDLMKERKDKIFALIPLDLDGYLFSERYDNGKTQQIRSRIAADFKGWEHDNAIFEREIERVIKALKTDGGKEPPPPSKL